MFFYIKSDHCQWLEKSYKLGSVRPSILFSAQTFFWIRSLVFPKFWHGARNSFEVVHDSWIFGKVFLLEKWKNEPEIFVLNSLKKLVINSSQICCVMKIDIIYCVPAQILYSGKNLVFEIWTKMPSVNQITRFLN